MTAFPVSYNGCKQLGPQVLLRNQREAPTHLRVVPELGVEALPGALVRVGHRDVLQAAHALPQQRDAALEQRQHRVPEVEALLRGE